MEVGVCQDGPGDISTMGNFGMLRIAPAAQTTTNPHARFERIWAPLRETRSKWDAMKFMITEANTF